MAKDIPGWHGNFQETTELERALSGNCACRAMMLVKHVCSSHGMLKDQRVLNGLLFGKRMAVRLIREEFKNGEDSH